MHSAPPSLDELAALLVGHRVWTTLDAAAQATLVPQWERQTIAEGAMLLPQGRLQTRLGMVVTGAVDLHDPDLGHGVRLQRGELFGFGATPARHLTTWQATAATDGVVAWLAPEAVLHLCQAHEALEYHFPSLPASTDIAQQDGMRGASGNSGAGGEDGARLNRLAVPVSALVQRAPVCLPMDTPIRSVAEHMREQRVSCVLLVEGGNLLGLVTDRDLRNRVLATGMDSAQSVRGIATLAPHTLQSQSPAFEALLLMARANIHHLPVLDGARLVGMVTATDLAEQQSTSAVVLAGEIYKQTSVTGLTKAATHLKALQRHLADADASAYSTGHIVTAITDAITVRLIQLAIERMGPAPVDYVWVAAGSQARSEQTALSDQDNCLVLADDYDEALHGTWFREFSKYVCDGLAACGYIHCPGEMMAMTDKWRQPRARWAQYFRQWVDTPEPMALMLTCVFFDLRAIHGRTELLDTLRHEMLENTRGNSLFLAHMVGNALKHRPPLGLFGTISRLRGGEHPGTIDLKHTGIVPIVDLARLFALAGGRPEVNTHDRLESSAPSGEVSPQSARDLREALEFISKLRIAHQARQIGQGKPPDNFLALEELSNFERSHLKEAFSVVQTVQGVLGQRYQAGRF